MERKALEYLKKWHRSTHRRPLIIRGARQVGKTWLVRHFAKKAGKRLIELNFEEDSTQATLFESNKPKEIVRNLEGVFGGSIEPTECVLFLDEIQAVPELYQKLRWFLENMPELPVISAGSLLEVVVSGSTMSMPVGRVSYMFLEPFSFEEFLRALGHESLCDLLGNYTFDTTVPDYIHEKLIQLFKEYLIVGGMPAAVAEWVTAQSLQEVGLVQRDLLRSYREDFGIYSGRLSAKRLEEVFKKVPLLLGKKFVYRAVNKTVRIESISKALTLLCDARVCHKVFATAANGIPLEAEIRERYFKVLFVDVGLCSSVLKLSYSQLRTVEELDLVNSGGLAEQAVGQLLRTLNPPFEEPEVYYWVRQDQNAQAEIDYIMQHRTQVVPVEVKAGAAGQLKSLHYFMESKQRDNAVRVYTGKAEKKLTTVVGFESEKVSYTLYSIPFYLVEQIHRLLDV